MKIRWSRAIVLAVCLLAAATAARAQSGAQWTTLDNYINAEMKEWKVPGMAVGIVQDGRVVYLKGFGVRDIQTMQPVTPETLFDIGSCTKAFTAAAVAMLVDEGKMKWDGRVNDYVPFFHLKDPLADEYVTMRDLLTHRTGMGGTDLLWYGSPYSIEEVIRRVGRIEPTAGFRTVFQYQNVMYAAAGYAAGMVNGGSWQDFVRNRIFEPLGMKGADFSATDAQKAPDHATPHLRLGDGRVVVIPWRNVDNIAPAGAINAGVRDMTKWIALQLNDGVANGKRLISASGMREMHTPQIVVPPDGEFQLFFPQSLQISYGMGWFIQDYRGHQIILHPGDIDGFASLVVLIPEVHTGFVILSNLDHNPVREGLGYHLIDEFLNLPEEDWVGHFAKIAAGFTAGEKKGSEEFEAKRSPNTHPSRELAAYAGTYRNDAYGDAIVTLEGDHLQFHFYSMTSPLEHFQYDTFEGNLSVFGGKFPVTFNLDEEGTVSTLRAAGLEFKRVSGSSQ